MRSLKLILFILAITVFNCNKKNNDLGRIPSANNYDIAINYLDSTGINWRKYLDDQISNDSIYLFLETSFSDTAIEIYLNGKLVISDTVTTIAQIGLAEVYTFGQMEKIQNFGIRVQKGKLMIIEPDSSQNIWRIDYFQNKLLRAQHSEHCPYYD